MTYDVFVLLLTLHPTLSSCVSEHDAGVSFTPTLFGFDTLFPPSRAEDPSGRPLRENGTAETRRTGNNPPKNEPKRFYGYHYCCCSSRSC